MAEASEERDFDCFMRWNMTALKDYLRKFGLSLQGKKVDLAARAFAAWEMKLEPRKTDAELAASRAASLAACLKVGDNTLPDPATLTQGWIGEKDGMKLWPPTMYFDICNFLGVKDMDKRLLADYKEGKAYSYFQAGKYNTFTFIIWYFYWKYKSCITCTILLWTDEYNNYLPMYLPIYCEALIFFIIFY